MTVIYCEECEKEIVKVLGGTVDWSQHPRLLFGTQEWHFCGADCLYKWLRLQTLVTPAALAVSH